MTVKTQILTVIKTTLSGVGIGLFLNGLGWLRFHGTTPDLWLGIIIVQCICTLAGFMAGILVLITPSYEPTRRF